jgi:hypothetical protein
MKLGIDIGRVLITPEPSDGRHDTSFIGGSIDDALKTPPYPGMFDVVPDLVKLFKGQVWLVSKAGPRVQEKSRLWLLHHRFFERTGIPAGNLRFCLQRPQKADHCQELGITHFIDDRDDVLRHLKDIVPHRFLFGPQKSPHHPAGLIHVPAWSDALTAVQSRLEALK